MDDQETNREEGESGSMQQFLFQYVEILSVLGLGTPENPGSDFDLDCWIEATDATTALEWGYVLLGSYMKARYARCSSGRRHDGSPVRQGMIAADPDMIAAAATWDIPSCKVGEIPEWCEPWRRSSIRGQVPPQRNLPELS